MKHKKESKRREFITVFLLTIVFLGLSLILKLNFITSTLLYFGIPSLYLSFKQFKSIKKILVFSFILFLAGTVMDYIAALNNAWFVPTVFEFRLFGIVPIEDLVWGFLAIYYTMMFYEYFIDHRKHKIHKTKLMILVGLIAVLFVAFLLAQAFVPQLLMIPNFYFIGGIIFLFFPTILFVAFNKKQLPQYIELGLYFFVINLLVELTALTLNHWTYKGSVTIGLVTLLGFQVSFEEFFFWICMGSVGILTYFEIFDE